MQKQYQELKQRFADCLLLFRLGDFYEGFDNDAEVLSKVLGITLTGRGKGDTRVPMAGIPYHALKQYLPKLIKAGYKVAIAEQLEEATTGKIVERDVVKIITAGTVIDDEILNASENNYIAAITLINGKNDISWGLSYADVSTGEFKLGEYRSIKNLPPDALATEIFRIRPVELLVARKNMELIKQTFPQFNLQIIDNIDLPDKTEAERVLSNQMGVKSLKGFGIEGHEAGVIAAAILKNYIAQNQKTELRHIKQLQLLNHQEFMILDQPTIRSLELIYPLQFGSAGRTLYESLNYCHTAMGQRLLKQWILRPLLDEQRIEHRLGCVESILKDDKLRQNLNTAFGGILDLERVISKLATRSGNARDLLFLKSGLVKCLNVLNLITGNINLKNYAIDVAAENKIGAIIALISSAIVEDPPITITEGNMINPEFRPELKAIKEDELKGKDFIRNLQAEEISKTGINNLKVRFNRVFGYYIEINQSQLSKVPANYIRKQTLANCERYITEELKHWEEKVLGAEAQAASLEMKIFEELRTEISEIIPEMHVAIKAIAEIDVLLDFANIASRYNYSRPEINSDSNSGTFIKAGRHPIVERFLNMNFIANDVEFTKEQRLIVLTGPNMAGKSTYIRQIALIILMAQIGCFVPAEKVAFPLVDRIYTRVGASDNLAEGESTFMVEMTETANILNNATSRSLLILDEVGRGTSTYDGVAIAWAVAEYLAVKLNARTLFATHYHELTALESKLSNVKNFNVEVKEDSGKIAFMRKIIPGATDKSYGVHVAELAGIPEVVSGRAKEILAELEGNVSELRQNSVQDVSEQLSFGTINMDHPVIEELKDIELDKITPLSALNKLYDLKQKLSK